MRLTRLAWLIVPVLTGLGACGEESSPDDPSADAGSDAIADVAEAEADTGGQDGATEAGPSCANGGAVTASFTASRATGAAPLAVFFDASATACPGCTGVESTWHDLGFVWDFGDAYAGTWSESGLGKNVDRGPSAAHVFEQPGEYTITLKVYPPFGEPSCVTKTLSVSKPDVTWATDKTYCFSASGDYFGCPANVPSANKLVQSDFAAALDTCLAADTRRCLFRRGETFSAPTTTSLTRSELMIGGYGPTLDKVKVTATGSLFRGETGSDVRILDLEVTGPGSGWARIFVGGAPQKDVLLMGLVSAPSSWVDSILMDSSMLGGNLGWHERFFLVESQLGPVTGYQVFGLFKDSALLGNDLGGAGAHVIRIGAYDNLLVAHNRLAGAKQATHTLTLRSPDFAAQPCPSALPCAPSRKAHVQSNRIRASSLWAVQVCGQVETQDNRCEDTLVEANFIDFSQSFTSPVAFHLADNHSRRTTFRNNICNLSGSAGTPVCAKLDTKALARAQNNTCHRADAGALECIAGGASLGTDSAWAENNLAVCPGASAEVVTGSWDASKQSSSVGSSPFIASKPTTPAEYQLGSSSWALIDQNKVSGARLDFGGRLRPAGSGFDLGAWESGASPP